MSMKLCPVTAAPRARGPGYGRRHTRPLGQSCHPVLPTTETNQGCGLWGLSIMLELWLPAI
jgi:hypothetical protein